MNPYNDPIARHLFFKELENQPGFQAKIQSSAIQNASRLGVLAAQVRKKQIRGQEARETLNRNLLVKNV